MSAPNSRSLRLAFMGTPDFSVPCLAALLDAGHTVVAVYTQPPRPSGRGQKLRPSPVQAFAEAHAIPVFTPRSLRKPDAQAIFAALALDAAVVVAYGLILPQAILDAPRLGCINVHASLLPRWRGAAPIQRAILAGDATSGVTIMQMDAGLDTGAMLATTEVSLPDDITAGQLHDQLSQAGAALLLPTLAKLAEGQITATPQPAEGVTYAAKIGRADTVLDWTQPAVAIARQVRAFSPYPGVVANFLGERIKILSATAREDSVAPASAPGVTLDDALSIACGAGQLQITRVQRAGKGPMETPALLRGFPIPSGTAILP
jgi:methionyl-tRNA formyltransferase